jgi:PAS domain S-box-containing protein
VILLVEDNPITRKMMRFALEAEGYDVVDAADGRAALGLSATGRPDLLVLDYALPDMDGLQLLAEVRRQMAVPDLPAIIVTGMVSRLEELRAQGGARTQFLAKPVAPSRLLEIVRAQLSTPERPASGLRVLILDDEQLNRKLASLCLKQAGYEVETASGGAEGLELARRQPPDAILTDVMMPSMDGFAFCREARRDPNLVTIPIVLVSSVYVDEADRELARKMGANALVVRTPDLRDAVEALDAALRRAGPPPTPVSDDQVAVLHRERVQVQLERQTASNEVLLRQAAIQTTALSIIRGLSEVLAQPKDVTEILSDVLVHCLDAAGLSTGLLYVVEPGGAHLLRAHFGIPADRKADAEACFGHRELIHRIVEARQPVAISSRADDTDAETRDFLARVGYSSVLILPFVILGETFGELLLASDSHDLSESAWIGFARSLALQFGQTVALGQSLRRLAESEGRYRALMEQANDAILILEPGHRVLEANLQAEQMLGRPRGDIVGRHYQDFVASDEQAESARLAEQLLNDGTLRVGSRQMVRPDGTRVSVEVSASLVRVGEESVILTILRDVTDRERAQQDIEQRMEVAAFAADVGAALIRNAPLPVVLQQCAEAMMRHLQPAFARIWTVNAAGDTLELQASAGMYTHLNGAHARVPVGSFKIGLIAAEREPHLTNDVLHDPRVSDQAWARREAMVAFAGYPLVVEGHVVGVMAMFARHPLSRTVLDAMAAVANQVALGIERKRAEEALRQAERRMHHLVSSSPAALFSLRIEGDTLVPTWVSENIERLSGYTPADVTGPDWWAERVHPDDSEGIVAQIPTLSEAYVTREYRFRHKDGSYRWIRDEQILVRDVAGKPEVVGSWSDITEKRNLEAQLLQSQKMESMGRLAGGVAHDFNNLLGIIIGYGDLLSHRVAADPRLTKYVDDIVKAADRAAGLTRQLLAFSRKQVLQPRILDLNAVVDETQKMLRRIIGEDIQLVTVLDEHLGLVRADPGQMDQILMNLAVNARDAMPRGGRLTIETGNVALDESYARQHAGVEPGPYVMLAVSDTGHGMTPDVQNRIFEPFFTTKAPGKGTGLGLATVHGIVNQSGGHIFVYSEPGHGTSFKVYLARTDAAEVAAPLPESTAAQLPRGSETIVLVEDEASLRELVRECLEATGYTVLEARHGADALEICEHHEGPIHLLVTDVVMPEMSGRELGERVRAVRPGTHVLYMSGYTDDAVVLHGVLAEDMAFLQKPFTAEALARKVRELLDQPTGKSS